ncbi:hypothetical protein DAPPUDRAFT_324279 [Daphnia pulex]|uniref:E3 ubiquitin ligase UBR4 C-terminal domain-containing protein n=1 Tax=Daphnia pulex TaxID=6669 RepID=E9H1E9_DAPPU|nr:hypothetical protein DAPPUDRAFT_334668 [Daphnia pulex]EFX74512.1 hypothetical protein DAPPUDRAFT_324279 [Daphnia pulex]|eukprot:EFX64024.1 hypothetical protein DAPPUDRAFT_334668 [Daphnia pulex]
MGMELLVCNKIMSLDLTVRDVYRKVIFAENNEAESMRIVYHMRGLLGDSYGADRVELSLPPPLLRPSVLEEAEKPWDTTPFRT